MNPSFFFIHHRDYKTPLKKFNSIFQPLPNTEALKLNFLTKIDKTRSSVFSTMQSTGFNIESRFSDLIVSSSGGDLRSGDGFGLNTTYAYPFPRSSTCNTSCTSKRRCPSWGHYTSLE